MSTAVLNTDAGLAGKTLVTTEDPQTVTGLKTFDRDPSAPFAVSSGSAKVDNLNADKWDGQDLPADPGADRIVFWDESADAIAFLEVSTGLTLAGTVLTADGVNGVTDDGTDVTQIKFAATQVPSSDVNTLDDYEEGTFTPTLVGSGGQSGQVYTTQVGSYIKIGKLVFVHGRLVVSTIGTVTNIPGIGGLPFTSENTTNQKAVMQIGQWDNFGSINSDLHAIIEPNTTSASLYQRTSSTATVALTSGNLSANLAITFSAVYRASA